MYERKTIFMLYRHFVSNDQFRTSRKLVQMRVASDIANHFVRNLQRNLKTKMRSLFVKQQQNRNARRNHANNDFILNSKVMTKRAIQKDFICIREFLNEEMNVLRILFNDRDDRIKTIQLICIHSRVLIFFQT